MASWLTRTVASSGKSSRRRSASCCGLHAIPHRRFCRGPCRRPFQGTAGPGSADPPGAAPGPAHGALRAHVVGRLRDGWSPQQIAGRLKQEQGRASVCHETIYRHVYGPEGREDGLYRHLPKARRRRGSRYGRRPRSASIPRERWIENRPAEVENRETFGHWEGDLLIFRKEAGKANVTSLVERKSRFTFLLANEDKRSAAVIAGIADVLRRLPEEARRTITFDRGSEFAGYAALDRDLAVEAYFC